MAKAGAREVSALSSDGDSMPIVLTAIVPCIVSNILAQGVGLNPECCHHYLKRDDYICNHGSGVPSRSDVMSANRLAPSRIASLCLPSDPVEYTNMRKRAVDDATVEHREPGYAKNLDRNEAACGPRWK